MPVELMFQIVVVVASALMVGGILFAMGRTLWTGRLPDTRNEAGNGGADGHHDYDGSDGGGGGGD